MKVGDLVMWKYRGKLDPKKTGIIVSDYDYPGKDGLLMQNVYWFDCEWVRPIRQQFLEVINESRRPS